MYKRKTRDVYCIMGNCGYGWDVECNCEDYADAKIQLKTYFIRSKIFLFPDSCCNLLSKHKSTCSGKQ